MKINIKYCLVTLAEGYQTYSPLALNSLFLGKKVSHILPFLSPNSRTREAEVFIAHHQISLSGVQEKYSLKLIENELFLTELKGDFILKPIPSGVRNASQVPANEHFTMLIASQVFGINTAICAMAFFQDGEPTYLAKRFDYNSIGKKQRQEDFATLFGKTAENSGENYKYNFSYEQLAEVMKSFVPNYEVEIEKLYKLLLFNYLIGNGDAHLKNFSLIETEKDDFELSPAYDLLNTQLHGDFSDLAARDGLFADDFETESFKANGFYAYNDWLELAKKIGIKKDTAQEIIQDFTSVEKEIQVQNLLAISFLSEESQKLYNQVYQDRLKKLRYVF